MFGLPELFGSAYILPALIVVVVLLIAILVLIKLRSGKNRPAKAKTEDVAVKTDRKAKKTRKTRKGAVAADGADAAVATLETPAETPVSEATPAETAPAATALEAKARSAAKSAYANRTAFEPGRVVISSSDPVQTILNEILQGWGDLGTEDTNRLEIFRRDRVVAAITAMELPKDLRGSESARTRLAQLKHYAAQVEQGPPVPRVEAEFAGMVPAAVAAAGVAPVAGAAEVRWDVEPDTDLWSEAATAEGETVVEAPLVEAPPAEAPQVEAPQTVVAPEAAEDRWGTVPAEEIWSAKTEGAQEAAEAAAGEEATAAAAAAAFWDEPETPAQPQEQQLVGEEAASFEVTPVTEVVDDSLSSLHKKVATAQDVMALPAAQRADVLAFLEPAELANAFRATADPELKKTVIDTLEHVGSPASLDILHQCLDDPDPEIQMHALNAADRLLGAS